jgi:hypothetical protein
VLGARVLNRQFTAMATALMFGLLGPATLFDIGAAFSRFDMFALIGRWAMAAGIVVGLVALTGMLADVVTTPAGLAGRGRLGMVGGAATGMVAICAVVWWIRADGGGRADDPVLVVLEVVAFLGGVTGAAFARGLAVGPVRPVASPLAVGWYGAVPAQRRPGTLRWPLARPPATRPVAPVRSAPDGPMYAQPGYVPRARPTPERGAANDGLDALLSQP